MICITSAMALAYLGVLPRNMIGFLTVDTTYSTNMIYFACNTLKQEKEKTIFVPLINIYYLVLISLCVLVIIGEHILQC